MIMSEIEPKDIERLIWQGENDANTRRERSMAKALKQLQAQVSDLECVDIKMLRMVADSMVNDSEVILRNNPKGLIESSQVAKWLSGYADQIKRYLSTKPSPKEPKLDGWISVEDRLPEDGFGAYLICRNAPQGGQVVNEAWLDQSDEDGLQLWIIEGADIEPEYVTHWQPLPAPLMEGS